MRSDVWSFSSIPLNRRPDRLPKTIESYFGLDVSAIFPFSFPQKKDKKLALLFIDGFGSRFFERFADEPCIRFLRDNGTTEQIYSQFPSTTTAHMTTLHWGIPIEDHGLYEWFCYEPALNTVICPLFFSTARTTARRNLRGSLKKEGFSPDLLYPQESTVYQRLEMYGVSSYGYLSVDYVESPFTCAAYNGASRVGFTGCVQGIEKFFADIPSWQAPWYGNLYIASFDSVLHKYGIGSNESDNEAKRLLSALYKELTKDPKLCEEVTWLLTADHGHTSYDPAKTVYLDLVDPFFGKSIAPGRTGVPLPPAGSPRDLFVYVQPEYVDEWVAKARNILGERAYVCRTDELFAREVFTHSSPRLASRLAPVCVLPVEGESVFLSQKNSFTVKHLSDHGGMTDNERKVTVWMG